SKIAQQAQQLKLASLGRLTAAIAHEIRNPLGAISHAAQLLAESETLTKADRKMCDIIQRHSRRVNTIVENVLQLSRRTATRSERIELNRWLGTFVTDFSQSCQEPCELRLEPQDRKSTRLNSSHVKISYAVFCLKKKNNFLYYYVARYCFFYHQHC